MGDVNAVGDVNTVGVSCDIGVVSAVVAAQKHIRRRWCCHTNNAAGVAIQTTLLVLPL